MTERTFFRAAQVFFSIGMTALTIGMIAAAADNSKAVPVLLIGIGFLMAALLMVVSVGVNVLGEIRSQNETHRE